MDEFEELKSSAETDQILYQVKHSNELGRYLVAATDIEAGVLIICEKPLVSGPADDETASEVGEIPMCLGCYRRMTSQSENRCSKCGWPVCGYECEMAEQHAANECHVFVKNSVNYPCRHTWPVVNKSILVLRTLLLKEKYPPLWQTVILNLEHHTQIRRRKPHCVKSDAKVLANINDFMRKCGPDIDEDIIRVSGIINVNAFSSIKTDSCRSNVRMFQCVYSQASLMANSCIPNASWSMDGFSPFRISIRAAVKIRKGDMISIAYNTPEMSYGTLHRIIAIEDVAHFVCKCIRCSDPTEANTFVSAIKCFHCEKNYLLPQNPTDPDSLWKCNGCDSFQTVPKIVLFLNFIEDIYDNIEKRKNDNDSSRQIEIKKLHSFIQRHERLLHRNHYILQEARMRIINALAGSLEDLDQEDLEKFIQHCTIMLFIADQLKPGFNKFRASIQFFLSQGLLRLTAINECSPDGKRDVGRKMYKYIHYLQTRSLLYFNSQHSYGARLTTEADKFVTCIQRQLKSCEKYLTSESD